MARCVPVRPILLRALCSVCVETHNAKLTAEMYQQSKRRSSIAVSNFWGKGNACNTSHTKASFTGRHTRSSSDEVRPAHNGRDDERIASADAVAEQLRDRTCIPITSRQIMMQSRVRAKRVFLLADKCVLIKTNDLML